MRMIYLASKSKARKEILKLFGFKFRILPTHIVEQKKIKKLSFASLVKINALNKAEAAAAKVRSGIVIAADTITVQDNRPYGKPANMVAARKMLKKLSGKRQDVFTGLAVIDKDRNKKRVVFERTAVYMDNISDRQIDEYFSRVSPLDKAGSFDIQGQGALFIRRIDGCFYNVVGLPLRRLYRIFKEMGILLIFICLALSGCSTEYNKVTGQEESYYISADKESEMGRNIAKQVDEEYKEGPDPLMQKRVEDIGKKIAAVCDRKDINYRFKVIDEDEVNAVSLPGGYIYIFKGLMDKVASDDELAAVIAHEVGHVVARHSIKKLQAMQGYTILRLLMIPLPQGGQVGQAADLAFLEIWTGYSREDELLADQLAARYNKLAGYDPRAMISFLEKLQEINRRKPLEEKNYLKTHPYTPDRIRVVKEEIGEKIGFTDYINIEQKKKND